MLSRAPGTGKSAYAAYLAQRLDRSLHLTRASDLLSPWVGMTEQQIRQMFEAAQSEGAVLFLDEADGLLADRSIARQGWEVTQVNEMLGQMEQFSGVFICATNLLEWLDEASFRRFAIKIHFDYLSSDQKRRLLAMEFPDARAGSLECHATKLQELGNLALGDIVTVRRKADTLCHRYLPAEFVEQLRAECRFKRHKLQRPIGFSAWPD